MNALGVLNELHIPDIKVSFKINLYNVHPVLYYALQVVIPLCELY